MICFTTPLVVIWLIASLLGVYSQEVKDAKCNKKMMDQISQMGKEFRNTDKVFQKPGLTWIVYKTTDILKYKGVSCLKYYTEGHGNLTVSRDGVNSTVLVKEKRARVFIKDDVKRRHLKIISDDENGVYSGYSCYHDGLEVSKENPPNMGLMVTSRTTQETIAKAEKYLKNFGYELSKKFTC